MPAFRGERLGYVYFLFLMFGISALPLVYFLSLFFSTASSAYARYVINPAARLILRLSIAFVFGGIGMLITVFVLSIPVFNAESTSETLKYIFYVHPAFAVGQVCILSFHP